MNNLHSNGNYSTAPSGITADLSARTVVNGAGGTDTLASGVTTLIGSPHNDDFVASTGDGDWTINGGGGTDLIAVYNAGRTQAQIIDGDGGSFDLVFSGTTIYATGIDQINFIDGSETYNPGSLAGQIVRLYQAAFNQAPDGAGLAGWVNQLTSGVPLDTIANDFLTSSEFQLNFPSASTDSTTFVTQLWQNVYHDAPNPQGLAAWVNVLDTGVNTRAQVLVAFAESAGSYADTAELFSSGIFVANEGAAQVARLYYSIFDQPPDFAGLSSYTMSLTSGAENLQQIAADLFNGTAFQQKYGTLSDLGFVDLIYHNVYNTNPSASTEADWVGALAAGTQTRASMVVSFSESLQHVESLAPVIENNGIHFS